MRKLASIRKIDEIKPIAGADAIECAVLGGWNVVVKRGEYKAGDLAIYCEVDSFIPNGIAPFLTKLGSEPREYNTIKGERLRTVRLRGQLSQGLLLPLQTVVNEVAYDYPYAALALSNGNIACVKEGDDVTELLGIQKWEPPIPACLAGQVAGPWPSLVQKTDQERCISGDTLIDTDQGKLTIQDIVSNKMSVNVYSFNHDTNSIELKPVIGWSEMTRKNTWVKIKMKSGKELTCTKTHKIWCDDIKAYRQAGQIEIGQKFILKTD